MIWEENNLLTENLEHITYSSTYYRIIIDDSEHLISNGKIGLFHGCSIILNNIYDWHLEIDEEEKDKINDELNEILSRLEKDLGYPPQELITDKVFFAYKEETYNKYFEYFDEIDDIIKRLDMGFSLKIEEIIPEKIIWEDENQIAYLEKSLREKTFFTANKLTYEEACEICKTPKRFLNYIRKHKDVYYKAGEFDKVESDLKYITGFIYGGEYCYSDYLEMIQEYFDEILPLGKEEDVEIYRGVRLDKEEDFNWDNIGNCWTYDYDSALEFLKYFTDESKKPFLLTATTNRDNIDWILSICLNLTHVNEKELRLYDESLIEDPCIESVDED